MIRWEVQRFRPEGVEALEVWNLPHRGGLLYQRLGTPAVEDAERAGQAAREVDAMLGEAVAFAQMLLAPQGPVWLAGGLCLRPGLRAALAPHRLQGLRFAPEPLFPGEVGAEQALARLGRKGGVLVDLGQTSIKLSALGAKPGREVVPRPLERLPRFFTERLPPPAHVAVEQAARLAEWLSGALARFLAAWPELEPALVLGLPCALADDGTPGSCTYAGWAGDASWVPRMLARVEPLLPVAHPWSRASVPVLLVNDAELASASASASGLRGTRALALTLGFGPGAAWTAPEPRRVR